MKRFLKGFVICISLVALLSCCVFFSFNKPKQVKAEPIALGVGALGALVAAYLATSGVELASSGMDASQYSAYLDSEIRNWDSASVSRFFLSDGSPQANIGLALIGNEVGQYYISMGQGITNMLETFKDWFVQTHSLEENIYTTILSSDVIYYDGLNYPIFSNGVFPYPSKPLGLFDINALSSNTSFDISVSSRYFYRIQVTNYQENYRTGGTTYRYYITLSISLFDNNVSIGSFNSRVVLASSDSSLTSLGDYNVLSFYNLGSTIVPYVLRRNSAQGQYFNVVTPFNTSGTYTLNPNDLIISSISVEGTLNEGYEDFEEALRQDQSQEEENSDAVYGLGVGTYEGVATPDLVLDGILERILAGTYEGTYEGVYENEEEFTEEKEQSSSGSISVPAGWVTISGLQDFFPWCIPFDLYNVIAIFNAPAQAPRFTWRMDFGGRFAPYDIEIDLSAWNTVAQVFRIMVVVAFLVFIIIKTRDLIRG